MRKKSRSPIRNDRGPSNSPSRVAAALQNSQGVGHMSYLNRSPLNIANGRRSSGSPLRQKSPATRPEETVNMSSAVPSNNDIGRRSGTFDENLVRMKKSCERIAAVLGIRNGEMPKNGTQARHSPLRTNTAGPGPNPAADYGPAPEPMNFTNMNNPSATRHMPPREEVQAQQMELPSAYKSLRERSPVRKGQASPERNDSADRTATKFASVS